MNMWAAIKAGAAQAIAADPRPLAQSRTMAAIDAAVARMPPYPLGGPVPDMLTGAYLDAPCDNPRERLGALYHTPVCICGHDMGRHARPTCKPEAGEK